MLDAAKVADVLLLLTTPDPQAPTERPGVDELGDRTLSMLKAQGLPSVVCAVQVCAASNRAADADAVPGAQQTTQEVPGASQEARTAVGASLLRWALS